MKSQTQRLLLGALISFAVSAPVAARDFKPVTAGGWAVAAEKVNGKFIRCTADMAGMLRVRFSFMANLDRYLSITGPNAAVGAHDRLSVTFKPSGKTFSVSVVQRAGNELRTEKPLTAAAFDSFDGAKQMVVKLASRTGTATVNLGDTSTMGAAIDGCLSTFIGGGAAPPPAAKPAKASGACVPGAQACPAVVRMARGAVSVLVKGELTKERPTYYLKFDARGGQMLTIEPVKDPGIKWGAGVPITFPGGKDGDAVDPGQPFRLPRSGTYDMRLIANTMADNPFGPFVVKITIK